MHHTLRITIGLLALVSGLAGCNKFAVKTPQGFVSLERYRSKIYYKAVSPDNAVITVSAFKHKDKGSLDFWAAILKREMVLQKGYKLTGARAVRTRGGLEGRQLAFSTKNGTTPYTYESTLFVTKRYIYVIEAAARAKRFKAHRGSIDALIASFRPR
jgi:hypothetical protein